MQISNSSPGDFFAILISMGLAELSRTLFAVLFIVLHMKSAKTLLMYYYYYWHTKKRGGHLIN